MFLSVPTSCYCWIPLLGSLNGRYEVNRLKNNSGGNGKVKDPHLMWVSGWPSFSVKSQMVKILALWAMWSLSQLVSSAFVAREQP